MASRSALFPALLKHWRTKSGLSQLDLAIASDVSARHISFLETGRSEPSSEMVLRLSAALSVPLRHVNAMLSAAGFEPAYPEGDIAALPAEAKHALELMKAHHDPYPLVIIDAAYNLVDLNLGAQTLFKAFFPALDFEHLPNLAEFTFDPNGARPFISNFDEVGRELLWRMQREVLSAPDNTRLRRALDNVLAMPTVNKDWRKADLSEPSSPTVGIHFRAGAHELRFVTTVTAFHAPQLVTLDELRIETWYPADVDTKRFFG